LIERQIDIMPVVERSVEESQNSRFEEVVAAYGAALERLARAYEADADTRRDLLQEILIALWRSFEGFDGRCSLRTWVYRVAHNTAASHVGRQLRMRKQVFVALEDVPEPANDAEGEEAAGHRDEITILYQLIEQLKPLDRQVMVAYLEGMNAASTAEVTGLSARNVATKIHRIKHILSRRFQSRGAGAVGSGEGGRDER
jgi:RNA polymerase sigma-70 factor (ECF subfamily)